MSNKGLLLVVSAPSGTGKTTVVEELVKIVPGLELSRSGVAGFTRDAVFCAYALVSLLSRATRSNSSAALLMRYSSSLPL